MAAIYEHICQTLHWVLHTLFEARPAQLSKNYGDVPDSIRARDNHSFF